MYPLKLLALLLSFLVMSCGAPATEEGKTTPARSITSQPTTGILPSPTPSAPSPTPGTGGTSGGTSPTNQCVTDEFVFSFYGEIFRRTDCPNDTTSFKVSVSNENAPITNLQDKVISIKCSTGVIDTLKVRSSDLTDTKNKLIIKNVPSIEGGTTPILCSRNCGGFSPSSPYEIAIYRITVSNALGTCIYPAIYNNIKIVNFTEEQMINPSQFLPLNNEVTFERP